MIIWKQLVTSGNDHFRFDELHYGYDPATRQRANGYAICSVGLRRDNGLWEWECGNLPHRKGTAETLDAGRACCVATLAGI